MQHTDLIDNVASRLGTNDTLIVLGDFNLPTLTWSFCDDIGRLMPFSSSGCLNDFLGILFELSLVQNNNIPNVSGRYLDLIFSNTNLSLCRSVPFVFPEDKFHPTLLLHLDILRPSNASTFETDCVKRFNLVELISVS